MTVSGVGPKLITQFVDDESLLFTQMMTLSIVFPEAEQLQMYVVYVFHTLLLHAYHSLCSSEGQDTTEAQ